MNFRTPRSLRSLALCCCLPLLLTGCGTGREPVTGTVTLDGQPLPSGEIRFLAMDGTEGSQTGANIENGKFEMDDQMGLWPGRYRVEITAKRPSETNIAERGEEPEYLPEQYLPARYNVNSELEIELSDGGELEPFVLTSDEAAQP